jgi:choline dehydrogenase
MAANNRYDYIIAGAGAAGCVLANRLLETPDCRVLLLEAGGSDDRESIHEASIPSMTSMWGPDDANWGYMTSEQPHLNGRTIPIAQGRVLGGSTSINAMIYVRGNRKDFDQWNYLGNAGWSYEDVLPYFKKSEDYEGGESDYHGTGGPLHVIDFNAPSEAAQSFIAAAEELGYAGDGFDCNAAQQEDGAFLYQSNRKSPERRWSTADAFLHPVMGNPNLTVITGAMVTRVLLDGNRAIGVEYSHDGELRQARADAEVILSAGAFASPKLLMLSGIGPAAHLQDHGIEVVVDLPGVGQNLQDHLLFGVAYRSLKELAFPPLLAEAGFFTRTRAGIAQASPDLQFFFGAVLFVADEYRVEGPAFTFAPILIQPQSRGTVTLYSNKPEDLAIVDPRYLESPADVETLVRGIEIAREFAHTQAMAAIRGDEIAPGVAVTDRAGLANYVRNNAGTVWHPAGTCKMGLDSLAVVNDQLQVYGVDNLRVADASIMPVVTAGNTNAATIMIAEKAADMIAASRG